MRVNTAWRGVAQGGLALVATQWPHGGHTVATQWPHSGHCIFPQFLHAQRDQNISLFYINKALPRPAKPMEPPCKNYGKIQWPLCGHCVATVWPLCGHCVATGARPPCATVPRCGTHLHALEGALVQQLLNTGFASRRGWQANAQCSECRLCSDCL